MESGQLVVHSVTGEYFDVVEEFSEGACDLRVPCVESDSDVRVGFGVAEGSETFHRDQAFELGGGDGGGCHRLGRLVSLWVELPRFCGQFAILFFHRWW